MSVSLRPCRGWGQSTGHVGRAEPGGEAEAKIHEAALLAGEGHGTDHEECVAALEAVHEMHDLLVLAPNARIYRDFSEVACGCFWGLLKAGDSHARFHRKVTNLYGDGGVVRRNALRIELLYLLARIEDALVDAAQRSGLELEGL